MPVDEGDITVGRARLEVLRRRLGSHLAVYRTAAGVSQPQLGQAVGRTRSTVSKIEHGVRGMPSELWTIADDMCGADGALVAEHEALAQVEQDYRDRRRAQCRQAQQAGAQAQAAARKAELVRAARQRDDGVPGHEAWLERTLVGRELAEELMQMVTRLVRRLGRRDAIQTVGLVLAAVGLSDLNPDECTRLAQAVASPSRVDAQVVHNLAATLAHCRRQEDTFGPGEVLDTVVAQHGLVHRLLDGGCPDPLRQPLKRVDSTMASFIGNCLVNMGHPEEGSRSLSHARQAGHDAGNAACAAFAAALASFAAFERGDTPTALDTAAAARSLAARTDDAHLKALAELKAATAYALDGQHGLCMAACDRAHDFLTSAPGFAPDSPAYWLHHGRIDSQHSRMRGPSWHGQPRPRSGATTCPRSGGISRVSPGLQKVIWFDGVKGEDVTDSHVDALARFSAPGVVILDRPAPGSRPDVWSKLSDQALSVLKTATDARGKPLTVVELREPDPSKIRAKTDRDDFLASYVNYYVANGAVFVPQFGDKSADDAAKGTLCDQFPGRDIVQLDIDDLAAGDGGIHCATQQQAQTPGGDSAAEANG